jgi:hypothetical protein
MAAVPFWIYEVKQQDPGRRSPHKGNVHSTSFDVTVREGGTVVGPTTANGQKGSPPAVCPGLKMRMPRSRKLCQVHV